MSSKHLPPLNAIRAFEAVARHGNITRAANELSVTPSAVSHLLRRLQQHLGIALVERSGRNIELTDEGRKLGSGLEQIFASLRTLLKDVSQDRNRNIVTVSVRPYFSMKWLSPKLGNFWAENPEIQIHLHHTNDRTDFLQDRDTDLAIEWTQPGRNDVEQTLLVAGELVPVFSPELRSDDTVCKPDDLFRYPLLRETDRDSWAEWFSLLGYTIPDDVRSVYMDDSNVRYQAALDGQGIELSCRSLITRDLAEGNLIAPFDTSISNLSYYLVEPINRRPTVAAKAFTNWIIQQT